jgi:hypothetical protein
MSNSAMAVEHRLAGLVHGPRERGLGLEHAFNSRRIIRPELGEKIGDQFLGQDGRIRARCCVLRWGWCGERTGVGHGVFKPHDRGFQFLQFGEIGGGHVPIRPVAQCGFQRRDGLRIFFLGGKLGGQRLVADSEIVLGRLVGRIPLEG